MTDKRLRLDRWLWYARFFKTRALAAKAVAGGHVKVHGERVKSGHAVKVGDDLEIRRDHERFVVQVESLPARRGPASEARMTYTEDADAARQRQAAADQLRQDRKAMPQTEGRPDKHTRRLLRKRKTNRL